MERPPPPAPPPSVEHLLPGGIGTYSISHLSYFDQRVLPKPEGSVYTGARSSSSVERNDENSNGSSFAVAGNGFTLWEECAVKKGKTGKENVVGDRPHGTNLQNLLICIIACKNYILFYNYFKL